MAKSVSGLFWMRLVSKIVLIATLSVIHHYIIGTQQDDWPIFTRVRRPDD